MFMKFKQQSETVFLDPNTQGKIEYGGKKLDIILSPSLYWVQKVSLPVKYLREVKKLLPSIFEEILPEGNYSYWAYKEGDEYLIFAYEDKKIIDLMAKMGINLNDVGSVCFAQAEFSSLAEPFKINNTQGISKKDEIVIVAPLAWLGEDIKPLPIQQHKCSSKGIKLQQYGHIVDNGSLYKIAAILLALIVIVGVEIFITKQKTAQIEELKNKVFSKYHLKSTMMQNRAILSTYKGIYEKQTKLREYIGLFLKMPMKKGQKITRMEYKNNLLRVTIKNMKKTDESSLFRAFKKESIKYKISYTKDTADVEIAL